jgi:hypothetical protein
LYVRKTLNSNWEDHNSRKMKISPRQPFQVLPLPLLRFSIDVLQLKRVLGVAIGFRSCTLQCVTARKLRKQTLQSRVFQEIT